jgi:hypothetical protein
MTISRPRGGCLVAKRTVAAGDSETAWAVAWPVVHIGSIKQRPRAEARGRGWPAYEPSGLSTGTRDAKAGDGVDQAGGALIATTGLAAKAGAAIDCGSAVVDGGPALAAGARGGVVRDARGHALAVVVADFVRSAAAVVAAGAGAAVSVERAGSARLLTLALR